MKKYLWMFILIIIVLAGFLIDFGLNRVSISPETNGTVFFEFHDKRIQSDISEEHMKQITEIFNNKFLYSDAPSCGFSEDLSIKIDNNTFCIAGDSCGKVYLLEKDKYFSLSDDENKMIRHILISYGIDFPYSNRDW